MKPDSAQPKVESWSLSKQLAFATGVFSALTITGVAIYKGISYVKATAFKKNCAIVKNLLNKVVERTITLADYTRVIRELTLVNNTTHRIIQNYIKNKNYEALHVLLEQEHMRLNKLIKANIFKRMAYVITR